MAQKNPLHCSTVIIPDPEIEDFSWDFHISPRSRLQKNIESVTFGGFNFHGLQFKTGFLADTDHKWGFSLYSNQINAFMSLPRRDMRNRYSVHDSKLQLLSEGKVKNTHLIAFQRDETATAPRVLWTSFWINTDRSWDDTIDTIRIIFRVGRESTGRCLISSISHQAEMKNKAILETVKHVDCQVFFLSDYLSDVTLECKGANFPAHRFILSCRSKVFDRMFRVGMKEVHEGRVVIEDMEPEVLKELLRFIYCSQMSPANDDICMELFEAADRYDIEPLKVLCETQMVTKVNTDNALDLYTTAELHDAKLLKEKAFDTILMNKKQVFHDRETFKSFAIQYPDIAYDLFSSFG